jgi:hypothetical protein
MGAISPDRTTQPRNIGTPVNGTKLAECGKGSNAECIETNPLKLARRLRSKHEARVAVS